jgi:hypothetical protein
MLALRFMSSFLGKKILTAKPVEFEGVMPGKKTLTAKPVQF